MSLTIADVAARAKVSKTTVSRVLDGKGELKESTAAWVRQFGAQVSATTCDGLLAIQPEGTLDYIATLHARGLPVVLIDDRAPCPAVPPSYRQRSRSAPPPRAHDRHRTRPSSGTPLTRFRNT